MNQINQQQSETEIAYRVILHYQQLRDAISLETAIGDLLADLRDLCDEYALDYEMLTR